MPGPLRNIRNLERKVSKPYSWGVTASGTFASAFLPLLEKSKRQSTSTPSRFRPTGNAHDDGSPVSAKEPTKSVSIVSPLQHLAECDYAPLLTLATTLFRQHAAEALQEKDSRLHVTNRR